jgi:hypothetical protein
MNPPGLGVAPQKVANESRVVGPLTPPASLNEAFAGLGFHGHKPTACAAPPVLILLFSKLTGAGRLRRASVVQQLIRLLVQAKHWLASIERLFVLIEHVFHPLANFFRELGNAPRFIRHGLRSWAWGTTRLRSCSPGERSRPFEMLAVNIFLPDAFSEGHTARQTQLDFAAAVVCVLQVNVIASSEQGIDIAAEGTVMVLDRK